MLRKFLLLIVALAAVAVAFVSYQEYYARKDVARMLNEARLTASIRTALALNRHLKGTKIEVSASGQTITLAGAVGTEIQKQLTEEITLSIKGVDKVQNSMVVSRALTLKPPEQERTLGEKLDDLTIEASVKTAFMLNENVRARKIKVNSERGEVTLSGTVSLPAEVGLARKIAEDVDGVIFVRVNLEVEGIGVRRLFEKVDDTRLVAQVRAALMVNRNIDSTEIEVSSHGGIVTLTGIVHSGAERDLAKKIAEDCWGVQEVANELRIK